MVFSSSSHMMHLLAVRIPLLLRLAKTGRLSCSIFQDEDKNFQRQLNFPNQLPNNLRYTKRALVYPVCVALILLDQRVGLSTLYSPELEYFHRSLSTMPSVLGIGICKIFLQMGYWYSFLTISHFQDFVLVSMRSTTIPSRRLFSLKKWFEQ